MKDYIDTLNKSVSKYGKFNPASIQQVIIQKKFDELKKSILFDDSKLDESEEN